MSMMDNNNCDWTMITSNTINIDPQLLSKSVLSSSYSTLQSSNYGGVVAKINLDPEDIANIEEVKEKVLKKIVDDPRLDEDYKIVLAYLREHIEKLMDSPDNLLTHLIEDNKDLRRKVEVLENEIKNLKK